MKSANRLMAAWFAALLLHASTAMAYSAAAANQWLMAQRWDDLLQYGQHWTAAQPEDAEGWYYLGQTYSIGFERPAEALEPLRRAVTLRPVWPQAWNSLGLVYTKLKQHREAIDAFQKAVAQAPRTMNYWFNLASAQSATNDFDAAHATLVQGAATAGPSTGYEDWYNLGLGFQQMHDCANATNAFAESVRRNPGLGDGWNNLGACQAQLGRFDDARASYRQAISLGNPFAAQNLRKLDEEERVRREMAHSHEEPDGLSQYQHRKSCSSGGSGTLGPCNERDMTPP